MTSTESRSGNKHVFDRYIGIDYSGAETPTSSLKSLRIYEATPARPAREVLRPRTGEKWYWTRREIAEWLVGELRDGPATLVGIDHGFSFPIKYFEKHRIPRNWDTFLQDFQRHWPTDAEHTYVDFIRDDRRGAGHLRAGNSRWRRLTEMRTGAKSVFHFDVPGSVAKSTHAGLPWLLYMRRELAGRIHFWPFDGWEIPAGKAAVVEVYPSMWAAEYPQEDRTRDQHDAYVVASWMRSADANGSLAGCLGPELTPPERKTASIEGWILGVPGPEPSRVSSGRRKKRARFVVCLDNTGYDASLDVRKIYRVVADAKSEKLGLVRVIDESGEDYLYPQRLFAVIDVSPAIRRRLDV